MKIQLKVAAVFKPAMGGEASGELDVEGKTIIDILRELSNRYGDAFRGLIFDRESGNVREGLMILVNGRQYRYLPRKMDQELEDGDVLAISPPIVGG